MFLFDTNQLFLIAPEIFLLSSAIIIVIIDLFFHKKFKQISYYLAQLALFITTILSLNLLGSSEQIIFSNSFIVDDFASTFKVILLILTMLSLVYVRHYLQAAKLWNGEYISIVLLSILGMMVMSSGYSMLSLYLGLEIMSLSLYTLIAMANQRVLAIEAALKYFILGSISSGILLYGISMLYGVTGSINIAEIHQFTSGELASNQMLIVNFSIVFLIVGIAFKLGAAPFHMWVPDVYHGSALGTTMFLSSIPKIAVLIMGFRILVDGMSGMLDYWSDILMFLGIFSVAIGSLVALVQKNIKRLLAYSTISHIGFVLISFSLGTTEGYGASVFYTWVYVFTSLAAFGVMIVFTTSKFEINQISDLSGIGKSHPMFSLMLLVILLSMAGIPPFVGLYAKISVLQAVVAANHLYLAIAMVIFAVVGVYYYLRIIKVVFFDKPKLELTISSSLTTNLVLAANVLLILVLGAFPNYFINLAYSLF